MFIGGLLIMPCFSSNEDYQSCSSLFVWQLPDSVNYEKILLEADDKDVYNLTSEFCSDVATLKCIGSSEWDSVVDYFDASQSIFWLYFVIVLM